MEPLYYNENATGPERVSASEGEKDLAECVIDMLEAYGNYVESVGFAADSFGIGHGTEEQDELIKALREVSRPMGLVMARLSAHLAKE